MSLEQKIEALTAAIEANTAALNANGGKAASTGTASGKGGKAAKGGAKSESKPEHSKEEVQKLLNEVREQKGTKAAKTLIADAGFDKLADVTEDKYDELYAAAKAVLEEGGDEKEEDDGL